MADRLLILTGPTAVGKTGLSVALARQYDAEIVSADSMQVYRGMDIGTAKISREEMEGIPHHLIDVLDPAEDCNVYRFREMAREAIDGIRSRGHLPMLVGGTGFYIQAILYDIDFTEASDNGMLRAELEERAAAGAEEVHRLWEELRQVDPEAAAQIHEHNVKRVIRALEYQRLTGEMISAHNREQRQKTSPHDYLYLALTDDRARLYERIEKRVDVMMAQGLVPEVQRLLAHPGVTAASTAMQALGYREIATYLAGEYDQERAVYLIKRNTRHFAKRQLTWFNRERDVIMVNRAGRPDRDVLEEIQAIIQDRWGGLDT